MVHTLFLTDSRKFNPTKNTTYTVVSKKLPNPMGIVISRFEVKEHLTTVLEELEWENLNVAQWKH